MRRPSFPALLSTFTAVGLLAAIADGCSASAQNTFGSGGSGGAGTSTATGMATSSSSVAPSGTGGSGGGIIVILPDAGDASDDVMANPCGSKCGSTELCDQDHLGLDDNCDGQVDEGCGCIAGQAHFCFKGDPAYRGTPGCFDGNMQCTEQGTWGPCIGGVHAVAPDNCFSADNTACHAITAPPYAVTQLATGTGTFSANAVAGSESYTVTCPAGITSCPGVMNVDEFKALQSGEYSVTYTKMVAGSSTPQSCTFPLFVGAPGLRVELSWEHTTADTGVDLDLHVHQPGSTKPWGISPAVPQDCTWSNCVVDDFAPPQDSDSPNWFSNSGSPPSPVNWYLDPVDANNTCYNDPNGVGDEWSFLGMGCHNPRLDSDNITCKAAITNTDDPDFCAPENINVDYPPTDGWTRIGVHYYGNHNHTYDVHPTVKIFCDGALAANLGPAGYYTPESPVTFESIDGVDDDETPRRFWMVADVAFAKTAGVCGKTYCTVKPLYADPVNKTPYFTFDSVATASFAPAYPALPAP